MYQRDKTLMEQKICLISVASQWKSTTKRTDNVIQTVFSELIKADLELLNGYFVTFFSYFLILCHVREKCHLTLCKAVLKLLKESETSVVLTVCGAGREERKSEGRSGRELCHLSPNLHSTLWTEQALREQTQRETTAHQHYRQAPDKTGKRKKKRGLPIMSYVFSVSVNKWTSAHLYSPLLIGCSTCPTKNMSIQIFSAEKKIVTHAASSVPTSFNLNLSNNVDGCVSLSPLAINFAYLRYCQWDEFWTCWYPYLMGARGVLGSAESFPLNWKEMTAYGQTWRGRCRSSSNTYS